VNGVLHSTFQEAARAHALPLDRKDEARTALRLAYEMCRSLSELRFLLALSVLSGPDLDGVLHKFEKILGDEVDGLFQIREKTNGILR
jgi:hypothetical protein